MQTDVAWLSWTSFHSMGRQYLSTVPCTALDATCPPYSAAGFDTCLTLHVLSLVSTEIHQDAHVPILTGAFLTNSELNPISSLLPKLDQRLGVAGNRETFCEIEVRARFDKT